MKIRYFVVVALILAGLVLWGLRTYASTLIDSYPTSNYSTWGNILGSSGSTSITSWGESFIGNGDYVSSVDFYIARTGTGASGSMYAKIYAITGTPGSTATPTGSPLAVSNAVDISTVTTSYQLISFTFSGANQIKLTNGTHYFVVFNSTGFITDTDQGKVGAGTTAPVPSENGAYFNTVWNAQSVYPIFYVYGVASVSSPHASVTHTGGKWTVTGGKTIIQ